LLTTQVSALSKLQTIFFCNPHLNLLLWLAIEKHLNSETPLRRRGEDGAGKIPGSFSASLVERFIASDTVVEKEEQRLKPNKSETEKKSFQELGT
jgi:hypothetical protein